MKKCIYAVLYALLFIFSLVSGQTALAQTDTDQPFLWGAVGHNDRPGWGENYPYNKHSIETQMMYLSYAGMNAYRAGCIPETCERILEEAGKRGITFLRSIEMRPDADISPEDNYRRGYDHAYDMAERFKGRIRYYEASNELDNWTGMTGDGATIDQYNQDRYKRAREFLRGLIDGVHAADPDAKVMVDNAGWCHYGFLQALWKDGLRWDITAIHWYESQGDLERAGCRKANVAKIHAAFGKPIWITEFNSNTAAKNNDPARAANWTESFMTRVKEIAPKYNIEAAFIYELFDEPGLKGGEDNYGIVSADGQVKPAWFAIKNVLGD
jgi:hypothetical protein